MKLVRYDCDCIGLEPDPSTGRAIIFSQCEMGDLTLVIRQVNDKTFAPLPTVERAHFIDRISEAFSQAERFKQIKDALS